VPGYAIQLSNSLFSELSFAHHKLGVLNPDKLIVLAVITTPFDLVSKSSSKGASEGWGIDDVWASDGELEEREIRLRVMVRSNKNLYLSITKIKGLEIRYGNKYL
jgi:hypothetical protein